jgi:23S rRNA pseudouridine1911/1915/1917 synthase
MINQYTVESRGRVDKFVAGMLNEYSRAALAKLYDMSCVEINGNRAKVGQIVRAGDSVSVDMSPLTKEQEVVELPIIFENDDVIVINKPSGIISHARGRYWYEPSVASFVRHKIAKSLELRVKSLVNTDQNSKLKTQNSVITDRSGIVHRLDRATSGVMITAKNEAALKFLQKQFADRITKKLYLALVDKPLEPARAIIDAPIARNPAKPTTYMVTASGKSSQTLYTTLQNGTIRLEPKTGRTHQLRVHLAWRGSPIIGDELYKGKKAERLMLHAYQLSIILPGDSVQTTFTAPPDAIFGDLT